MSNWQPLVIAGVSAGASIFAAAFAGFVALRAKGREINAQRIRDLESRLSDKKLEMYKPAVELLTKMVNPEFASSTAADANKQAAVSQQMLDFVTWISIYGSPGAVTAFRNFRQATFHGAPPMILMRLYAELLAAIRRDIGGREDEIEPTDILALTLTDVYTDKKLVAVLQGSFREVCRIEGWEAPWLRKKPPTSSPPEVAP